MSKLKSHLKSLFALATRHKFVIERTIESKEGSHCVYEYGPLGTELRRNLRQLWWRDVVTFNERIDGIELSVLERNNGIISSESVGDNETESKSGKWFQGDSPHYGHLVNLDELINALENKYNDMNKTKEDIRKLILKNTIEVKTRNNIYREGFSMFHKTVLSNSQISLPQGYAWIGMYPAMECDQTNFLRNIQEELLCLQFYSNAKTAKYWLNYWRRQRLEWWRKFANVPSNFSSYELQQKSHMDCVTENQYMFPWGKEQIESIEYWSNCSLFGDGSKMFSGVNNGLSPHVLQASANLDKGFTALLADAYEEKEHANDNGHVSTRSVLYLHPTLAPIKVAILSQNKETNELSEVGHQLASELRQAGICTSSEWDGGPSEEMYPYYDEIGTPYCIIILDSTLSNGVVALRNRDTTLQEFIHISDILKTLQSHLKTL